MTHPYRKNISTEEGCMVHAMGCSNGSSDSSWESLRFHEIVLCSMNHAVYVLPYRTAPILLLGRVAQRTIFKMITDFNIQPMQIALSLHSLGGEWKKIEIYSAVDTSGLEAKSFCKYSWSTHSVTYCTWSAKFQLEFSTTIIKLVISKWFGQCSLLYLLKKILKN